MRRKEVRWSVRGGKVKYKEGTPGMRLLKDMKQKHRDEKMKMRKRLVDP